MTARHNFAPADGSERAPFGLPLVPFDEAIAAAKRRRVTLPDIYYNVLQGWARRMAFTVTGLSSLRQVETVLDSLNRAIEEGQSFQNWQREAVRNRTLHRLPSYRRELIFRNAVQGNYAAGRAEQIRRNVATHPYLLYSAVNDARTRPAHAAMDGTIQPVNSTWWATHYPPLGHNCRCTAIPISRREAARRGVTEEPPAESPDPGWPGDGLRARGSGINSAVREAVQKNPRGLGPRLLAFIAAFSEPPPGV